MFVHCNSFEDGRRVVTMQAGVNGFGFVLRNSSGNGCYTNYPAVNFVIVADNTAAKLVVSLSLSQCVELTATGMTTEVLAYLAYFRNFIRPPNV